jgi:hypothetical protein
MGCVATLAGVAGNLKRQYAHHSTRLPSECPRLPPEGGSSALLVRTNGARRRGPGRSEAGGAGMYRTSPDSAPRGPRAGATVADFGGQTLREIAATVWKRTA